MAITFEDLIFFATIFNALILGIMLLFSGKNRSAGKWLGLLVLAFAINLLSHKILNAIYLAHPAFTLRIIPTIFTFGPLIYLYTLRIYGRKEKRKIFVYFIPFFIDLGYHLWKAVYIYVFDVNSRWKYFDHEVSRFAQLEFLIHDGIAIVYSFYFFYQAYRFSRSERQTIRSVKGIKSTSLNWLTELLFIFMILLVVWSVYHIIEIGIFPKILFYSHYMPLHIATALYMLYLGYRAIWQGEVTAQIILQKKYANENMSAERANQIASLIQGQMDDHKLYLNPHLALNDLALAVNATKQEVSFVLSENLDKGFYDLLNYYRVEKVKQLLLDPDYNHMTIISLAYDSGFNSNNAFYAAFKKEVGMTPSKYRQQQQ